MKLSKLAWINSEEIIHRIQNHPFNQDLMNGTLTRDKFIYYIEQDVVYLNDFARCLALLASKAPLKNVRKFLKYADDVFHNEQEVVHQFYHKKFKTPVTGKITQATLSYTAFLFKHCTNDSFEIGLAAILPCFWVYQKIGVYIAKHSVKNNGYARWIETYSSDDFKETVNEVIALFDDLAEKTSEGVKQKMLTVFHTGVCLEWHFWNDAYNQVSFDTI